MYLRTAALAAFSGLLCIAATAGLPLWDAVHGHPRLPATSMFSLWGLIALMGAAANLYVYWQTTPPARPPRGGNRIAQVTSIDARRRPPLAEERQEAA